MATEEHSAMKKTAFFLTALLVLTLFFSGIATASPTKPAAGTGRSSFSSTSIFARKPTNAKAPSYVPNEVIVKFKTTSGAGRSAAGRISSSSSQIAPDTQLLKLKQGISVENAVATMKKNPDVACAEPNGIIKTTGAYSADEHGPDGQPDRRGCGEPRTRRGTGLTSSRLLLNGASKSLKINAGSDSSLTATIQQLGWVK